MPESVTAPCWLFERLPGSPYSRLSVSRHPGRYQCCHAPQSCLALPICMSFCKGSIQVLEKELLTVSTIQVLGKAWIVHIC